MQWVTVACVEVRRVTLTLTTDYLACQATAFGSTAIALVAGYLLFLLR